MMPRAAILLVRISDDREGEGLGVGRQEADGRRLADRIGWGIAEVIVENDTSAFRRRKIRLPDGTTALRVVRPDLRRALELLASGERDGLMAYDLDRYTRDPRDLEDLLDLVEQQRIPVTSVTGSLRLDTDADVTMARVMVAVANKSSRDTSRRVRRKHEQLAEQGKPSGGGRRAFGYEPDGMTVREDEAEAIRAMAALILEGKSLYDVVRHLTEQGIRPSYAETWNTRSVSSILGGPRITGLRVHRGEIVGEATWPAILDREVWDRLQVALRERTAAGGGKNTLVRWLSQCLECSLCGAFLIGWSGPKYWCASSRGGCGRIAVDAVRAEADIEQDILRFLATPEVVAGIRSTFSDTAVAGARGDLAADETQLKELAGMWARRELSFAEYQEARAIITKRMEQSKALSSSPMPRLVKSLLHDPKKGWGKLTPPQRREVVLAITGGYRVLPASEGLRKFDPDRLVPKGR